MGIGRSRFIYTPTHNPDGTYRIYNPPVTLNRKWSEFPFLFHYNYSRYLRRFFFAYIFVGLPIHIYGPQKTVNREDLQKRRLNYNYTLHEPPRPFIPPEVPAYKPKGGLASIVNWSPPKYRSED
ncbi:uncharacterized protein LOC127871764 [Dreissena polymorpha]|uniref:Uncharacterized protein n=1 Tax=Dreissena polymorpha TaxID=45954 RepID=A0A9D4RA92_DREPO|nr:uncharacterized protein LOC127871764 [Dreissena polymorpha]KAH3858990.1 hypothetical protein DPMN_101636 [Dreissena polymorpha]